MVSFICGGCGDTLKKPKLDQHFHSRCGASFTCLDCSVEFHAPQQWKGHTTCISEAEKYEKSVYKGPKNAKGKQKQQQQQQPQQQQAAQSAAAEPAPPPAAVAEPAAVISETSTANGDAKKEKKDKKSKDKKRKREEADSSAAVSASEPQAEPSAQPAAADAPESASAAPEGKKSKKNKSSKAKANGTAAPGSELLERLTKAAGSKALTLREAIQALAAGSVENAGSDKAAKKVRDQVLDALRVRVDEGTGKMVLVDESA